MSERASKEGGSARNTPQPEEFTPSTSRIKMNVSTLSPTSISLNEKKDELQNLNNRFASYISGVKDMETEIYKLKQELKFLEEMKNKELSSIKVLFETELNDLRYAVDHEAGLKNVFQIKNKSLTSEIEELSQKLNNATEELKEATAYAARFYEINLKYEQVLFENNNLKEANNKLTNELSKQTETVKNKQRILEEEMLEKDIVKNQFKNLKDRVRRKKKVSKQVNNSLAICRKKIFEEPLIKPNDSNSQIEIEKIRQETLDKIKENKLEVSELFDCRIKNLENELQRKKNALEVAQEESNVYNSRITELTQQINDLLLSNNDYLSQIVNLKQSKELQRTQHASEIQALDQQLIAMQEDMSQKVQEYQDLMDIKVALDVEISAYRKLLDNEERRLSITPNRSVVGGPRAKKRKLFHCDETEYEFSNVISGSSTSDIEICEVCPDGQFVKLYNKGSQEFALSGYKLVHTAADQNVSTEFEFHSSVKLGAGNWLTIWSSTASNLIDEASAGSIVMDNQAWVVGDLMATILLNPETQEVATHELKKEKASDLRANDELNNYEFELFHQLNEPQTKNKCVIM